MLLKVWEEMEEEEEDTAISPPLKNIQSHEVIRSCSNIQEKNLHLTFESVSCFQDYVRDFEPVTTMIGNYLDNEQLCTAKRNFPGELKQAFYFFTFEGVEFCCTKGEFFSNGIYQYVNLEAVEFDSLDPRYLSDKDQRRLFRFREYIIEKTNARSKVVSCVLVNYQI